MLPYRTSPPTRPGWVTANMIAAGPDSDTHRGNQRAVQPPSMEMVWPVQ